MTSLVLVRVVLPELSLDLVSKTALVQFSAAVWASLALCVCYSACGVP